MFGNEDNETNMLYDLNSTSGGGGGGGGESPTLWLLNIREKKKNGQGVCFSGMGAERADREKGVKIAKISGKGYTSKTLHYYVEMIVYVKQGNR